MKPRNGPKKEGCCPDCAAAVGEPHKGGCDIERCPECGLQRLTCCCITDLPDLPWTGEFPGVAEAKALGLWCVWDKGHWQECDKDDPRALADINKLHTHYAWDKTTRLWVKRDTPLAAWL